MQSNTTHRIRYVFPNTSTLRISSCNYKLTVNVSAVHYL